MTDWQADPYQPPSTEKSRTRLFAPLTAARLVIEQMGVDGDPPQIRHYRDEFLIYRGSTWRKIEDGAVRAAVYKILDTARVGTVTPAKVSECMDALKALVRVTSELEMPAWLGASDDRPPAAYFVPVRNGLLHLPTGELWPPSADLFAIGGIDCIYDPDGPEPRSFLTFLNQLWPEDPEVIKVLQEWAGYLMSADRSQQKALVIKGPRRSGKGTLGKVFRGLVGAGATAAPSLSSLGRPFGMECLIGKRLAVIPDARIDRHADKAELIERMLSVIAGDLVEVERKHKPSIAVELPARFVLLTNEFPRLPDASQALAGRFFPLALTRSFYGVEDIGLAERLLAELPAIVRWALAGLHRLWARGFFVLPKSSYQANEQLHELASPVKRFVDEQCRVAPEARVVCADLYAAWTHWCEGIGRKAGTDAKFGWDLHSAFPELTTERSYRADNDGKLRRVREYVGIDLI